MNSLFSHVLGLLLTLAMPVCAVAQADWQTQPSAPAGYNEGYSSTGTLPLESADAPRPFAGTSGSSRLATYPPADTSVIRAGYEAPVEAASPANDGAERGARPSDGDRVLARGDKPPHLLPRSAPSQANRGAAEGLNRVWTTGAALALVLGLFCVVAWIMRRAAPKTTLPLPAEVVETLGRAPLAGRQCVHLVRCGRKLLLVSVTPERATTLTEITDPIEVDRLAGLCDRSRAGAAAAFRQVFEQFSHAGRRPLMDDHDVRAGSYFDDDRPSHREGRDV